MSDIIIGRNPVIEAIKSGREIDKIIIQNNATGSVGKIRSLAKENGIVVNGADKAGLDRLAGSGAHQGVVAFVSAHERKIQRIMIRATLLISIQTATGKPVAVLVCEV